MTAPTHVHGVGVAHRRREDARLVTGEGRYVANLGDAALFCGFVRASVAHGRLDGVGLGDVQTQPGIRAAFAAEDLDLPDISSNSLWGEGPEGMTRPPLARDRVRYAGEPVAVVVGDDVAAVSDAVEWAEIEVTPLPVVMGVDEAANESTLLFPRAGTNVAGQHHFVGGVGGDALEEWPVAVTLNLENQRVAPVPLEPHAVTAEPEGAGVTVWCQHQAPNRLRRQLAALLGMNADQVRVVVPDVGGGFGHKGMLYPEQVVVAAIASRLGRRVQWVETRHEQFLGGTHGRAMRHRIRLAGEPSGRIRAASVEVTADLGAYPHNALLLPRLAAFLATGCYDIADVEVATTALVTNTAPLGSYRGAGRPEAAYAIERAVDAFAREVDRDPVAVRRVNFIPPEAMPYRTASGALYDSGNYEAALDRALALADVTEVRQEQQRRRRAGGPPLGVGVATFMERTGEAPGAGEHARVAVEDDGQLTAHVGAIPTGQGNETTCAQLVAGVFDVSIDTVHVMTGDTRDLPEAVGSFASRSAQLSGTAAVRAAEALERSARDTAADLLEARRGDLRLESGRYRVVGDPGRGVSLADVAAHGAANRKTLEASEEYVAGAQAFPYGAYVAVVEVDIDTGRVTLRRFVAVDDCGVVINPMVVEGQLHGSLAQGIAQALYEGVVYSADGQPLTASLVDYLVPSAADVPSFTTDRLETPAPSNPLGVKGAGESGSIGAPPAVVNAVLDALAPYGVRDLAMPLTPERVWRAMKTRTRDLDGK